MADRDRDTGLQDHLEGTGDEVEGRAKQATGGLTGDRTEQGEGLLDEIKGKVKDTLGGVKDRLSEATNREADERP
ncbi:MAG TPA: CsbD family protein [Chloroflexota bacterium]|nr:CsbD family protein [Chloroflexota bacterium]